MDTLVNFFRTYGSQAGEWIKQSFSDIYDFLGSVPSWLGLCLLAVLLAIVVRILINVF